jgi:hypothetical protein
MLMRNFCSFIVLITSSYGIFADNIDVFGANEELAAKILKYHRQAVFDFQQSLKKARLPGFFSNIEHKNLKQKNQIEIKIAKHFHLPGVRLDTVYYPDQSLFTTIEVLSKPQNKLKLDVYRPLPPYDLIDKMLFFQEQAIQLYLDNPPLAKDIRCQDFHCIVPEHSRLQKELEYFRRTVPLQQEQIDAALQDEKYLMRQRAAIFLLTYCRNHAFISKSLTSLLNHPNRFIQHDALRVLGEFLKHYPHTRVSIHKISEFLQSDDVAVRHKALIVLEILAHEPQNHQLIKINAQAALLRLLKLKQPNNHNLAQKILNLMTDSGVST